MPHTIVFDTNYLRSLGTADYLSGKVPQKLHDQISIAISRGDSVVVPETVRIETNAWLHKQSVTATQKLVQARDLLKQAGHKVRPDKVKEPAELDILEVLNKSLPDVQSLPPRLEDYTEAERRTSYRSPPLPKKTDAEEFRDRIIWCQVVNYSKAGGAPILIVSGDTIFKNGAQSDEGKAAEIEVVEGETDFDQWLDQRPQYIQAVIDQLLSFGAELKKQEIELLPEKIVSIEELRNMYDPNGLLVQRFMLRTSDAPTLPSTVHVRMVSLGDLPLNLILVWPNRTMEFQRELSDSERDQVAHAHMHGKMEFEHTENRLREIIGKQP